MDDKRPLPLEESDAAFAGAFENEQQLSALFARCLPPTPLPPDLVERTQQVVLGEVGRTYRAAPAAVLAPHPAKVSRVEQMRHWWRSLSPGQSLAMSGAVAAMALLLFVGITQLTPQTPTAVVTVNDGSVLVLRDENNSFRTFYDDELLKVDEGDHLISNGSTVLLAPFVSQQAILQPGAHLEIVDLEDDFGATQVEYMVHRGSLHNMITAKLDADDRYLVRSPILTVSAVGTDFSVETASMAETHVTVFTGTVTVQMGDQIIEVGAGQEVDAVAGARMHLEQSDPTPNAGADLLVVADVNAAPLAIHDAPAPDAAIVATIAAHTVLRMNEFDSTGDWRHVCCVADRAGWINLAELVAAP